MNPPPPIQSSKGPHRRRVQEFRETHKLSVVAIGIVSLSSLLLFGDWGSEAFPPNREVVFRVRVVRDVRAKLCANHHWVLALAPDPCPPTPPRFCRSGVPAGVPAGVPVSRLVSWCPSWCPGVPPPTSLSPVGWSYRYCYC